MSYEPERIGDILRRLRGDWNPTDDDEVEAQQLSDDEIEAWRWEIISGAMGRPMSQPMLRMGSTFASTRMVGVPLCPDLLRLELLGAADTWRGRVVRGMFRMLGLVDRVVPTLHNRTQL